VEGPVQQPFLAKVRPIRYFRRIDPDYYYPSFGDDGVVQENGANLGQGSTVKASNGENYGMWGNFKVGYLDKRTGPRGPRLVWS